MLTFRFLVLYPILLLALIIHSGCAIAEFGKANVDPLKIELPSGLVGQDKASIMKTLGNPDYVLLDADTEYWGYRNHNGWFIYPIYVSFGMTESKDLILELSDSRVKTSYMIDKGTALGIFMAPMSVGN